MKHSQKLSVGGHTNRMGFPFGNSFVRVSGDLALRMLCSPTFIARPCDIFTFVFGCSVVPLPRNSHTRNMTQLPNGNTSMRFSLPGGFAQNSFRPTHYVSQFQPPGSLWRATFPARGACGNGAHLAASVMGAVRNKRAGCVHTVREGRGARRGPRAPRTKSPCAREMMSRGRVWLPMRASWPRIGFNREQLFGRSWRRVD